MAASKKLYEAVADLLYTNEHLDPVARASVAVDLANVFKRDNPRFNRDKFYEAAGANLSLIHRGVTSDSLKEQP
jgi:hypothetical protein